MFVTKNRPAHSPVKKPGISQGPPSLPVPTIGRPGPFPSHHLPPGVSAAPSGAGLRRAAASLPDRTGPATGDAMHVAAPGRAGERRRARRFGSLQAAALALAALVLSAVLAEAACGVRDRVSHRDSECLRASWDNYNGITLDNEYSVRNMCPDLGRVVAKIDLVQDMDRTLHLNNGYERTGYTEARIRWIYCCSDLSTACNRSDLDRRDGSARDSGVTATGKDFDDGAHAEAWLAGFGRSVASAQVDRLGDRLAAGDRQPHLTLGGYRIDLAPGRDDEEPGEDAYAGAWTQQVPSGRGFVGAVDDDPFRPVTRSPTGPDFLSGSSFLFTGGETGSGRWSGWGSTAPLWFSEAPGTHGDGRLDLVGVDRERGRLLTGVALSHGSAAGSRAPSGFHGIGTSFRGVHPYLRLALDDRFSVWGTFGFWAGDLTLREGGGLAGRSQQWRAPVDMSMAAVGASGAILTADEAGGFALTAKADAYAMRIASGALTVPGEGKLAAAEAEASRLRLAVDGSRVFLLGSRHRLAAALGVGLVRDGGEGGVGTGVALNASLQHALPEHAISAGLALVDGRREYTLGWRMEPARRIVPGLRLDLEAARREHTAAYGDTEHAIHLGATIEW